MRFRSGEATPGLTAKLEPAPFKAEMVIGMDDLRGLGGLAGLRRLRQGFGSRRQQECVRVWRGGRSLCSIASAGIRVMAAPSVQLGSPSRKGSPAPVKKCPGGVNRCRGQEFDSLSSTRQSRQTDVFCAALNLLRLYGHLAGLRLRDGLFGRQSLGHARKA